MTPLNKPVFRMGVYPQRIARGKRLVVSLEPGDLVGVRIAKSRKTYYLPLSAVYSMAVKIDLAATKAAKKAEREQRKKDKR